jgi:hypothetical protein
MTNQLEPPTLPQDLAPIEPRGLIGLVGNRPHQAPRGIVRRSTYDLGIVEFDDQGRCYDRRQMDAIAEWLATFVAQDVIIVVFVHGWKHDARSDDDNLTNFETVLYQTAEEENTLHQETGGGRRPVLGVFVGWRGMSLFDRYGVIDNVTFWDRQQAGRRVSVGSVRELFGRFRHYRNSRVDSGGAPLLVIVGHSFGGMIVYSALAQSLIEAATPAAEEITTRFADLVLLVNPAFEAARYLPIYDQIRVRHQNTQGVDQPPVFVCVTATNDWATGIAFPLGNMCSFLTERWLGREERQAMVNTIGHLEWLKTHDLQASPAIPGYQLVAKDSGDHSPFWTVGAAPSIVDGHNGIFLKPFLTFVASLVFRHVSYTRAKARAVDSGG